MDRFGDDLTELILSFFWFEDKIRLECVSKQWKRCVFRKQFVIKIGSDSNDSINFIIDVLSEDMSSVRISSKKTIKLEKRFIRIDNSSLETLLKKCPNITNVRLYSRVKTEVLSIIGRYCPRIIDL